MGVTRRRQIVGGGRVGCEDESEYGRRDVAGRESSTLLPVESQLARLVDGQGVELRATISPTAYCCHCVFYRAVQFPRLAWLDRREGELVDGAIGGPYLRGRLNELM